MPLCRLLLLALYYYGSYPYRWWRNRRASLARRLPLTVLLYHRVADDCANEWTVSNCAFVRQIRWLARSLDLVSLEEVQRRIRDNDNSRLCASITFDDGYAENCHAAIPLLVQKRVPCTYFVSVRNILEGLPFEHDLVQGNRFMPNTPEQLCAMARAGVEIGVHGYTHADLGKADDARTLHQEIVYARQRLEDLLGRPVRYFAFPFGGYANLSVRAFQVAFEAGYEGVCSAYGGYNFPGGDAFHLQRFNVDESLLRLKSRSTIDPRKLNTYSFPYQITHPCPEPAEIS